MNRHQIKIKVFSIFILGSLFYGLPACIRVNSLDQDDMGNHLTQERNTVFECSMHPQVVQTKPGDCPICGMALTENQPTGNSKEIKNYICSMDPEVIAHEPGDCPICGMVLVEKTSNMSQSINKVYVCSMHPDVVRDKPGDCPICGMSLIDKITGIGNSADETLNTVVLPVNEYVFASVETTGLICEELPLSIEAAGIINYDTRKVKTVSAHYRGLIEKSYIKYKYQPVHKGQKIFDIYCPDIYLTHMNYVNLLKKVKDQPQVTREAREWLVQIGLTDQQIEKLINEDKIDFHLSVYSDVDGFVMSTDFDPEADYNFEDNINESNGVPRSGNFITGLNEGGIVEAGDPLFKVVSMESVRADLKIKTQDAMLLKTGQDVTLTDAMSPENILKARVSLIEPLNGGLFQVVRVYINNSGKRLYPGMKIQAQIHTGSLNSLWVPNSAVVNLGQHKAVFMLRDKVFVATAVKTGMRTGGKTEIRSGIDPESMIAVNASLLTDSDGFIITNEQ